jgi:hypothetical protein
MSIGGSSSAEDKSKPGDEIIVSEEDRKDSMSNDSTSLDEYCPGRNFVITPLLTIFTPTNEKSE